MSLMRSKPARTVRSVTEGTAFAGCDERQRRRLDQLAAVVTVPAGRVLTQQGQVGREFGVILDGEAVVEIDGREVARLHAGDHYGEMALLAEPRTSRSRRATVTAVSESTVAAMTVAEFKILLADMPEIANRIMRTAIHRASGGSADE